LHAEESKARREAARKKKEKIMEKKRLEQEIKDREEALIRKDRIKELRA